MVSVPWREPPQACLRPRGGERGHVRESATVLLGKADGQDRGITQGATTRRLEREKDPLSVSEQAGNLYVSLPSLEYRTCPEGFEGREGHLPKNGFFVHGQGHRLRPWTNVRELRSVTCRLP